MKEEKEREETMDIEKTIQQAIKVTVPSLAAYYAYKLTKKLVNNFDAGKLSRDIAAVLKGVKGIK